MSYTELTPTLLRQFEEPIMVPTPSTTEMRQIWRCRHCSREFSFMWHRPNASLYRYTIDRAEELRDHLLLECGR